MIKDRTRQEKMLQNILEVLDPETVIDHLLGWVSSDDACNALEDMAADWDIDLDEEMEEKKC